MLLLQSRVTPPGPAGGMWPGHPLLRLLGNPQPHPKFPEMRAPHAPPSGKLSAAPANPRHETSPVVTPPVVLLAAVAGADGQQAPSTARRSTVHHTEVSGVTLQSSSEAPAAKQAVAPAGQPVSDMHAVHIEAPAMAPQGSLAMNLQQQQQKEMGSMGGDSQNQTPETTDRWDSG